MNASEPEKPFGDFVANVLASQAARTDAELLRLLAEKTELQAALRKAEDKIKELREINERLAARLAAAPPEKRPPA